MKILIVDDSVHVHHQIRAFLGAGGYCDLIFTASAEEAFAYLGMTRGTGEAPDIDLILMDIEMENINGIEATGRIKERPEFLYVPIIMVTADTMPESLDKAFNAGAVDYITKPLKKVELLARVKSCLMLKQEILTRKAREKDLIKLTAELEHSNAELSKANETLGRLADSDGLTGIANRRYFDNTIQIEYKRAARNKTSLALLLIDIDFFKQYNDHYGHLKGDECLRLVSQAMAGLLKRPADLVARYGGEEFAVVLPEIDIEGAAHIAAELLDTVKALQIPHTSSAIDEYVTVSMGVAVVVGGTVESVQELVGIADKALYQAKTEGRNRWLLGRRVAVKNIF